MEKITLPGTDLEVSRVCLGTMQFAGSVEEGERDRGSGAMIGAQVRRFPPNAMGERVRAAKFIKPGDRLERVNGRQVLDLVWHQIMDVLKATPKGE